MQWWPFSSKHSPNSNGERSSGISYSRVPGQHTVVRPNKRCCWLLTKAALTTLAGVLFFYVVLFRTEFNARVYIRNWVYHKEIEMAGPLSNCFDLPPDSQYIRGYSHVYEITPGVPLVDGFTCYDFAATIRVRQPTNHDQVIYHTYLDYTQNVDDAVYEALRSFFATQDDAQTHLFVWTSNLKLGSHPLMQKVQTLAGDRFQIQLYQPSDLSLGTPLHKSASLDLAIQKEDVMRLLILYRYGGLWFDIGGMFVRDLSPLFEHEWISQGNCADGNGFDPAFMRFRKASPYVCELLHELEQNPLTDTKPKTSRSLYTRIHRRLLQHAIRPWAMMPWCFTDPQACTSKLAVSTAFVSKSEAKYRISQIFAVNSHQRWDRKTEWIFQYLKDSYKAALGSS